MNSNIKVAPGTPTNFAPFLEGQSFTIGSEAFPIHTYSITMMLGILASILTIAIFWRRARYKWDYLFTLILITVPLSIIGSRLWFLVEAAIYSTNFNFANWYKIWEGGLSIQGGIICAFIADITYVYSKRHVMDIRKVADIIIPTILIGQVIGRWGNYANHEVFGKIDLDGSSSFIFGDSFANNMFIKTADGTVAYRYPLFLYESIANFIGYIILVWIINWMGLLKPGSSSSWYFIYYGLVRLAMEPLREESYLIYTIAAYLFIIGGTISFIFFQFFNPTHYLKEWRKYRFIYVYAHPEKYIKWIEKTRFKTKNSYKITEVYS